NPAREAELACLLAGEEAVADALHIAADLKVEPLHGRPGAEGAGPKQPPIGSTVPSASRVKVPVPESCANGAPRTVKEMCVSRKAVTGSVPGCGCQECDEPGPAPGLSW